MRVMVAVAAATFGVLEMVGASGGAVAAYVTTIEQVGTDVVATGSGSIDTTDLTFAGIGAFAPVVLPAQSVMLLGATVSGVEKFGGFSGPPGFGPGGEVAATSKTGNGVGVIGNAVNQLVVPLAYVSGASLGTSTDTFGGTTLAGLGLTDGTYLWTWGTGAHADSFTLQVGAVPEPASIAIIGTGLVGLCAMRRRKRLKAG